MKANKYQRLAMRTANLDLSPEECLLNAVLGLAGESGELCKILSKVSLDDGDRKSTRLNSSHIQKSRMPSSA